MSFKILREEKVRISHRNFTFHITNDYQISFYTSPGLDKDGWEKSPYEKHKTDHVTAIRIFRKLGKFVTDFIYETKPPYVWFNIHYDENRIGLYTVLSRRFEKIQGYHAYPSDDKTTFYIIKERT